jgi:KipI family sensor histidine kinase inhibitor
VRYGGEEGPDLEAVAREVGVGPARVVALHSSAVYRVAFVGFSPGFAYLLGLPPELEVPRLAAPRERVAAGSVAVAGPFSAIYPSATPGGWRLLGRILATGPPLFDPTSERPSRLAPGDRVRFVAAR